MHKPGCAMKLGTPSEEGTCAVLVECDCGQREIEYVEIQRILDKAFDDLERGFDFDASEKPT